MTTADPEPVLGLDLPPTPGAPPVARVTRRMQALPLSIAVVVILGGSALFMSGYSMGRQSAVQPGTPAFEENAFVPFWDTFDTINERYAGGEIDRDALIQGAIRGMIEALGDPFSAYMTSEEYRASLQGISGQFEGIGAHIATRAADGSEGCVTLGPECRLVITGSVDGSPAMLAGLVAGDEVLEADGIPLDGLTIDDARDRIRGPKGSTVTLTIVRAGGEPFELAIVRDVVQSEEVESRVLGDGAVGYVRLEGFSDVAADQLKGAFEAHVEAGRTSLILDLRGNPGGYVTAARAIASQFIGSGVLFWEQDASGEQISTEAQPGGVAIDPELRLIALIDGGTASASEIVAAALQESGRAILVGQTSYGKGTVQQWQELTGEGGAFRLTVARWLTPSKQWVHETGVVPDVVVTVPETVPAGEDPTLDKALELLDATAVGTPLRPAA
jgi:carboxyl-terminal processing protease